MIPHSKHYAHAPERRNDARNRLTRIRAATISCRTVRSDGGRNASSAARALPNGKTQLHKRRIP